MDIYLNADINNLTDSSDTFDAIGALGYSVDNYAEAILTLTLLSGYISFEDLFYLYGRVPGMITRKVLPKLVKDKLLVRKAFDKPDGSCASCYVLTKKGADMAKSIIGTAQKTTYYPEPLSKRPSHHVYAIGCNLFQLLRFRLPFFYLKEVPYEDPYKVNKVLPGKAVFRSDCNAIFRFYRGDRIVHIEEDRVSEGTRTLTDKIYNYHSKGCFNNEDLVFSIRAAGVSIPLYPGKDPDYIYSATKVKELISVMEEYNVEDARALLDRAEIFPKQAYLNALLTRLGFMENGIPTIGYFRDFYQTVQTGISPYQQADFNMQHLSACSNIISFISNHFLNLAKGNRLDSVTLSLIKGKAVGVIPTSLLESRLPYIMLSDMPSARATIMQSLSSYFGALDFIGESGGTFTYGLYKNRFMLRNEIGHVNGRVFVEFPCLDAMSLVRTYLFAEYIKGHPEESIQLVCVFYSMAEAERFFVSCDFEAPDVRFTNKRASIYGMLFGDIGSEGLFLASGEGKERMMVPLHSPLRSI